MRRSSAIAIATLLADRRRSKHDRNIRSRRRSSLSSGCKPDPAPRRQTSRRSPDAVCSRTVDGHHVIVGTQALLDESEHRHVGICAARCGLDGRGAHRGACRDRRQGRRRICDRRHAASERRTVVASLKRRGLRVVMLSGDRQATAEAIARPGRHRRGDRRSAAGRQGRRDQVAAAGRASRRDDRRRPQRRAGAGAGRHRHGDGVGHRHRGRSRVGHADAQRPRRRRAGDRARPQDDGRR